MVKISLQINDNNFTLFRSVIFILIYECVIVDAHIFAQQRIRLSNITLAVRPEGTSFIGIEDAALKCSFYKICF